MVLIIEIARFMTEGRNAEEMVGAARRWGGKRGGAWSVMILPAVVGFVPMPAGALFSAPFVEQAGARIQAARDWKSAVNYWFRHVWEYWWPLYPGVIVAMSVFDMDVPQFIAVQFPYTLVSVAAGYAFLIRRHMAALASDEAPAGGSNRRAAQLLMPLALVIACALLLPPVLKGAFPGVGTQYRKMLCVLAGLVAAVAAVAAMGGTGRRKLFSSVLTRGSLGVLLSLLGVLVFKFMLERSGLLPLAGRELASSRVPVAFAVAGLPFLAGLVTGVAVGFSGASFPLVVGLMAQPGSGLTPAATLVLAYGFGYAGMMLSPVHLCLLVTKDYFAAPMLSVYRKCLPCVAVVLLYCVAAYAALHALRW
jgi:integral membrane protein (TIGR00529 family)